MQKVIDLTTMLDYKDYKSLAEAILNYDKEIKHARVIVSALSQGKLGKGFLGTIQRKMDKDDLQKIAVALDEHGYMYKTFSRPCSQEQQEAQIKRKNPKGALKLALKDPFFQNQR